MLHVAEFNDLNKLDVLRLLWKRLWQKTRQASFRQSFEYYEHYCRQHEATVIPKVLYVSIAHRPIGILPLILRRRETSLGRLRVMSYPTDTETVTFGPIGPNSAATLSSAMRHLRATRRDWDVINLCGIDSDGLDRGRTRNALTLHGFRACRTAWQTAARIDFDQLLPITSTDDSSHDKLDFVRHRPAGTCLGDDDCRWDLFADWERLSDGKTSVESRSRKARHSLAVTAGASDLALLYQDGHAIAGSYGFHVDGHLEIAEIAVAPNAAQDAVTQLLDQLVADGRERDDASYTFSGNAMCEEAQQLATSSVRTERLRYFAKSSLRGQLVRLKESVGRWATTADTTPAVPTTTVVSPPRKPQLKVIG